MYAHTEFPHGLLFHHFHDDLHPTGQGSISAEKLADIIEFAGRERILNADEWIERSLSGTLRDSDLCITFDDNLLCQYDIAYPVLQSYGIKAFWFIFSSCFRGEFLPLEIYRYFRSTEFDDVDSFYEAFYRSLEKLSYGVEIIQRTAPRNFIDYLAHLPYYTEADRRFRYLRDMELGNERYEEVMDAMIEASDLDRESLPDKLWMNEGHIKKLCEDRHVIGLHTHNHPTNCASLPGHVQHREYAENIEVLESITGHRPLTMAHPCGSYNADTLDALNDLNIEIGFRADVDGAAQSLLEQPRMDHAVILKLMAQ